MQIISNDSLAILRNSNPRNFKIKVDLLNPITIENGISNSDFSDGTTGWSNVDSSTLTVVDGVGQFTCPNNTSGISIDKNISKNNKVYIAFDGYSSVPNTLKIELNNTGVSQTVSKALGTSFARYSMLFNTENDYSKMIVGKAETDSTFFVDNFILINLTTVFGFYLEPTKEIIDEWLFDKYTTGWFSSQTDYTVFLKNRNIIENSISIDSNSISSSNIELGSADTTEFTITLDNSDKRFSPIKFEGATLTVWEYIGVQTLKLGTFVVDEPPKKVNKITLKALDNMARFNVLYLSDYITERTLSELIIEACYKCSVPLGTTVSGTFTNSSFSCFPPTPEEGLTFHQVVSWIAELAGCNAWIDNDGALQFSWYGTNQGATEITITPSDRFKYEIAENDITITGLSFKEKQKEDYLVGTDEYALVIENNPLLKRDSEGFDAVVTALNDKIVGFTYRPFNFNTIGFPHLQPMDKINILTVEGDTVLSYIMNHNYKLNGKSTLKAQGKTVTNKGYATFGEFTPTQKRILQNISTGIAKQETSNIEQEVLNFNALMSNAIGFHETIVTDTITGAKTRYVHNEPLLKDSTDIYMQNASGFAYANSGWSTYPDGVPDGGWIAGMTADGNIIGKILSVVGLNADWINAGTIDAERVTLAKTGDSLETSFVKLEADYIALGADVGNLKTGGGNLVKNPTLGTTDVPAGDWWSTGITWGEVNILGLTWQYAYTKTWQQALDGEI